MVARRKICGAYGGLESAVASLSMRSISRAYARSFRDNRLLFELIRKSYYSLSNRRVKYISKLAGLDGSHAGHFFLIGRNVGSLYVKRFNRSNNYNGWWKSQAASLYLRCEKITVLKIANACIEIQLGT